MAKSYDLIWKNVQDAGSWQKAATGLSNTPELTDAQKWRVWLDAMHLYKAVTPLHVVKAWVRIFHTDDPLHRHYGKSVVHEALRAYPQLKAVFRGLGLSYKTILENPPANMDSFLRRLNKERDSVVHVAKPKPKLRMLKGEQQPLQPKNIAVMPAEPLLIDLSRFAIMSVMQKYEGISVYNLLETCLEQNVTLGQIVDLMRKVAS